MEKKEYTLPNEFGRYNTKIKKYRDGSCTVIYADSDIFLPSTEVVIDDEEFAKSTAVWLGRKKSKSRKIDREKFIDGLKEAAAKQTEDSVVNFKSLLDMNLKADEERAERSRTDSMKRAVDKVYDIAFQNEWKYFFTGTLNEDNNFSRYEPKEIIKPLNKWLNNQVNRKGLQYLIIPEVHPEKGEGIHFHGLMNDALDLTDSGRVLFRDGNAWRREDLERKGEDVSQFRTIYNVNAWKYGYSTAIPLQGSPASIACYITKYITKDVKKLFGRFYYSSRNIEKSAEMIYLHTDKACYEDCGANEIRKFGVGLKYQSDFKMRETDKDRNPTEDILTYLSERGLL